MIAFIAIVLIVLIALLSAPVKAVVRYCDKKLYADIYVFGMKVYTVRKKKTYNKNGDSAGFEKEALTLTEKLKVFRENYSKIVSALKKYSKIEIISLNIIAGTGDAATTAISVGSLWAVAYALVSVIGKIIFIDEHKVSVTPDYVNTVFKAEGECIIKSRFVYIIIIACKFFNIKPRKCKEE